MGLELQINAELYKRDLLKTDGPKGKQVIVPVNLYRLVMEVPFQYVNLGERTSLILKITIYDAHSSILYYGKLSNQYGIDPDLVLAFGLVVPKEKLSKPYTFFERFVEGPNGMVTFVDDGTGVMKIEGIAAYSSLVLARHS